MIENTGRSSHLHRLDLDELNRAVASTMSIYAASSTNNIIQNNRLAYEVPNDRIKSSIKSIFPSTLPTLNDGQELALQHTLGKRSKREWS